jgi:hypothetical protein
VFICSFVEGLDVTMLEGYPTSLVPQWCNVMTYSVPMMWHGCLASLHTCFYRNRDRDRGLKRGVVL